MLKPIDPEDFFKLAQIFMTAAGFFVVASAAYLGAFAAFSQNTSNSLYNFISLNKNTTNPETMSSIGNFTMTQTKMTEIALNGHAFFMNATIVLCILSLLSWFYAFHLKYSNMTTQ